MTAGRWNGNLWACYCKPGHFYSVPRGCVSADRVQSLPKSIKIAGYGTILDSTDERVNKMVRGVPLEIAGGDGYIDLLIRFRDVAEKDVQATLWRPALDVSGIPLYDLKTVLGDGLNAAHTLTACRALLGQANSDGNNDVAGSDLCEALGTIIEHAQNGNPNADWMFVSRQLGQGADVTEYASANLSSDRVDGHLSLVGKGGGVYTRILTLSSRYGIEIRLLLAPSGMPMGGDLDRRKARPAGNAEMMTESVTYFDRLLQPLAHHTNLYGNRHELREAAARWLTWMSDENARVEPLETDGLAPHLLGRVNAMLVEYSVDPRYYALAQRLALDWPAVWGFWQSGGALEQPWFGGTTNVEDAIAQVVPESDIEAQDHGTAVASLLARDLPNIKMSLMSAHSSMYRGPANVVVERIARQISRHAPQVVNISQDFGESIANCDAVFGPIFRRFEQSTLFVVAAGNDGVSNPTNVCPASIASKYQNVVVVGGTNDDGTIGGNNASNFGRGFVNVAAPYCQVAAYYKDGSVRTKRFCGTSFATPVVANAALRVFEQRPFLKPSQALQMLMGACEQQGIEVGCGGRLDLEALEELILRVPVSAREEALYGTF